MKKLGMAIFLAAFLFVQLICFTACSGFNPDPMYNKTYEYTGKAMPIYWDEMHDVTYDDLDDLKKSRREVLEKYFDQVDWELTKESFRANQYFPIELTDEATKSVDAFIAFMDKASQNAFECVDGFKFKIGAEADEVDVEIVYPNGKSQTVKLQNGGTVEPEKFKGIQFGREGENGTEIQLGLCRTGNKNVAMHALLFDSFTMEQTEQTAVNTIFYYTLMDENNVQLMDIDLYPEYTETTNA